MAVLQRWRNNTTVHWKNTINNWVSVRREAINNSPLQRVGGFQQ